MNDRFEYELSSGLARHVRAASATPADAAVAAQRRLEARLQRRVRPADTGGLRWLAVAATLAMAATILIAVPFLSDSSHAFAAVRDHFRNFETLSMRIEQSFGGKPLQTSRVLVDAAGRVRTDVGDQVSVIVDAPRGQVLTLLHGPRRAMRMPLPEMADSPGAALDWLEEIRAFRGKAERLEETRTIDGRQALGWALDVDGTRLTLWADHDGLPLAMEQGGGGLQLRYRFAFDVPVPPGSLSADVPPGYTLGRPDGR